MKKVLLAFALIAISLGAYSQAGSKSLLIKGGYETDWKRFGVGFEGRYEFANHFRIAPDVTVFFPKNHTTGLDINANIHYVVPVENNFALYPLAGIGIVNNRWSHKGDSHGNTDVAFNLGFGGEYNLGSGYLNAEFKYMFSDVDCAVFMFGYGIRF